MATIGAAAAEPAIARSALKIVVTGHVQAVGYRPFVYRLATELDLAGWVRNRTGSVEIVVAGVDAMLAKFERDLVHAAPPLAQPVIEYREHVVDREEFIDGERFEILPSEPGEEPLIFVPPDYFMCDDCAHEQATPSNRRFRYPFINCTQCGPRYTLIRGMPYDRSRTTMAKFELCDDCRAEYHDPVDRRFHAEPLACPDCGPTPEYVDAESIPFRGDAAIEAAVQALRAGRIVAVRGIGGYHLMCDARDESAVASLRLRKARPDKPLAVMFPAAGADGLDRVRSCADLSPEAAALISGPGRPIVLVTPRDEYPLADGVAPDLSEIGVFLPYSPLHQLLLNDFGGPLVATSGNLSGEPVLTNVDDATTRLARIADAFLHHDRPIERPADDPVYRVVAGRARPIRLGRGCAPTELQLGSRLQQPTLAVGGHLKNTIALAWHDRVVVSPHIGEMNSPRSMNVMRQVAEDLQKLYCVRAEQLVCDAHPGYATTRWARTQPLPTKQVLHHHAHASALAGEHPEVEDWLIFAWDGVGRGDDDTLWGGEAFCGRPGRWRRRASLKTFRLPGGDLAARQLWRSAAALCWEAGIDRMPLNAVDDVDLARAAWQRDVNCHVTSAAGRLFDAAANLVLGIHSASFEGQGPMLLEAIAADDGPAIDLPLIEDDGLLRVDWRPLLPMLCDATISAAERAAGFHLSLAAAIANSATTIRRELPVERVGLTGGVFQNAYLAAATIAALEARGFRTEMPTSTPCNDAGLSFGQIVEHLARERRDD
ncbi:MAG: carbamoyltransferase HypF [Gammaproteobacteria bacterium]